LSCHPERLCNNYFPTIDNQAVQERFHSSPEIEGLNLTKSDLCSTLFGFLSEPGYFLTTCHSFYSKKPTKNLKSFCLLLEFAEDATKA